MKAILESVEHEVKLCDEVETASEFTYLCDRVNASGGCEAAVTSRKDVGGSSLGIVVNCCMTGGLL